MSRVLVISGRDNVATALEALKPGEQVEAGGGMAYIHRCDLADIDDIDRMADEVLAQHGYVDVLINNAGRSIRRSIALSYDRFHDFERTMQLNYFGAVKLILKLLPRMRERRSGQIINISSIGVQTNTPRFSAYVASKAALDAFSRCMASEIIDDGVEVTTIHMPLVRTNMIAPTKLYDHFPAITPDEAGEMVRELVKRGARLLAAWLELMAADATLHTDVAGTVQRDLDKAILAVVGEIKAMAVPVITLPALTGSTEAITVMNSKKVGPATWPSGWGAPAEAAPPGRAGWPPEPAGGRNSPTSRTTSVSGMRLRLTWIRSRKQTR